MAVVTAFVIGVPWELRERERDYQIRIDHQQAAIAARPLPQPQDRPEPTPSVLEEQEHLVVTPEAPNEPPKLEETFGLPLDPADEPTEDEDQTHRTASDDESLEFQRPISERVVFEEEPPPDSPTEAEADTTDLESTDESEELEQQASDATSSPRTGARARLSGKVRAPDYPDRAIQLRWEGDVVVEFAIATDGRVTEAEAVDDLSCRFGLLKIEAEKAVRGWQFDPATEDGRAVESRLRVRIRFRLRGGVGVDVDAWEAPKPERTATQL